MQKLTINRTANANLQNEINISVIFNYLRTKGSSYRAQISKALNISAPAVSRAVEHLITKGYFIEQGTIKTDHGKKATTVMINTNIGYIVAVDIIKEHVRLAVSDFAGKIRQRQSGFKINTASDLGGMLIREIESISKKYLSELGASTDLKAISLGIPATTDFRTGRINTVLYENIEHVDLHSILSEHFNVPVYIDNISKLSAIGENNYGTGKKHSNIIFLEIGNGIGAGIISNNSLLRGHSGYAGEIGYSLVNKDELESVHLRKGALEMSASIDSMVYDLKKELFFGAESVLTGNEADIDSIEATQLFEAAVQNDTLCMKIIERAVRNLSTCVVNMIFTLDPEIIYIGGDVYHMPGVDKLIIEPMREIITQALPFDPPIIQLSSLGEDAGIIGAVYLAIETLLTGKYPFQIG